MIILINYFYIIFSFFVGLMIFAFNRKHLLIILLRLEFIVLIIYILLVLYLNIMIYELSFRIFFLTISVCEGALGLSILVSMIRTHGNDYFQCYSILGC